jgi:hypothetical protein
MERKIETFSKAPAEGSSGCTLHFCLIKYVSTFGIRPFSKLVFTNAMLTKRFCLSNSHWEMLMQFKSSSVWSTGATEEMKVEELFKL